MQRSAPPPRAAHDAPGRRAAGRSDHPAPAREGPAQALPRRPPSPGRAEGAPALAAVRSCSTARRAKRRRSRRRRRPRRRRASRVGHARRALLAHGRARAIRTATRRPRCRAALDTLWELALARNAARRRGREPHAQARRDRAPRPRAARRDRPQGRRARARRVARAARSDRLARARRAASKRELRAAQQEREVTERRAREAETRGGDVRALRQVFEAAGAARATVEGSQRQIERHVGARDAPRGARDRAAQADRRSAQPAAALLRRARERPDHRPRSHRVEGQRSARLRAALRRSLDHARAPPARAAGVPRHDRRARRERQEARSPRPSARSATRVSEPITDRDRTASRTPSSPTLRLRPEPKRV